MRFEAADDPKALARQLDQRLTLRTKAALVVEILRAYVRIRRLLRTLAFTEVVSRLRAQPADPLLGEVSAQLTGIRLGRAVSRTLRVLPADTRCLVRSLVLTDLLARRGIESSLVLGVKSKPSFAAHAWVECGDVPVLPTNGSEYQRLSVV